MEHQQENKHEQSEYLFSTDVTTTKSRSAEHGNGKAVGFWSDKREGNSNRDCPFLKQTEIQIGSFKGGIPWDYLVKAKKNEKQNT